MNPKSLLLRTGAVSGFMSLLSCAALAPLPAMAEDMGAQTVCQYHCDQAYAAIESECRTLWPKFRDPSSFDSDGYNECTRDAWNKRRECRLACDEVPENIASVAPIDKLRADSVTISGKKFPVGALINITAGTASVPWVLGFPNGCPQGARIKLTVSNNPIQQTSSGNCGGGGIKLNVGTHTFTFAVTLAGKTTISSPWTVTVGNNSPPQ